MPVMKESAITPCLASNEKFRPSASIFHCRSWWGYHHTAAAQLADCHPGPPLEIRFFPVLWFDSSCFAVWFFLLCGLIFPTLRLDFSCFAAWFFLLCGFIFPALRFYFSCFAVLFFLLCGLILPALRFYFSCFVMVFSRIIMEFFQIIRIYAFNFKLKFYHISCYVIVI